MYKSFAAGGCLFFFLLSRVPAMRCPFQLNVDEGQMLAQAMRYGQDLTPWRAVDGETGGPILSWFLLLAHRLGMPFSFCTAHVLAVLCLAGILLASFAAAHSLFDRGAALVGLAAGSWWLALTPDEDFTHYSSELVPVLLISLALVCFVGARHPEGGGDSRHFVGGLLLGLVPWAKLQAVPIALALGLWVILELVRAENFPLRPRRRRIGILIAGAFVPSAFILTWVVGAGAWDQFWHSYIIANLARAAGRPWIVHASNLVHLFVYQAGSSWLLDTGLLAAAAFFLRGAAGLRPLPRRGLGLAVLLLAAALYASLRPVTQYSHYEQLCLVPLILIVCGCASVLLGNGLRPADSRRRWGSVILAIGILPLPAAYFHHYDGARILRETWWYDRSPAFELEGFADETVRHFAPQPASLAVWGWAPFLYVDLGIAPGTRDAGYTSLHDGNPSQDFMRAAFLRDLEKSAPQVVVDAESDIEGGVRRTAPAIFPAFESYLKDNYNLVGRATGTWGQRYGVLIDVYLRRR